MKRVVFIIILLAIISSSLVYNMTKSIDITIPSIPKPEERIEEKAPSYKTVTYDEKTYAYALYSGKPGAQTNLIANFSEMKTSKIVASSNSCTALINGGYYTTNNTPLGLFVSRGETLGKSLDNPLINGFVQSDSESNISISDTAPNEETRWAFQTGPFLIANGRTLQLSIRNDTYARRSVIAVNDSYQPTAIIIMMSDHTDSGPRLADVPEIVFKIADQENLHIVNAINLDGGGASAYLADSIAIPEHDPVGSFICFK